MVYLTPVQVPILLHMFPEEDIRHPLWASVRAKQDVTATNDGDQAWDRQEQTVLYTTFKLLQMEADINKLKSKVEQ